ncbi:hypothetical protein IMG5_001270 [Ichthyophthirius multifiliis]|uniref:carbonic anhydrase n=1 Tax=Ichthyophthirius multifiliis TaxID=5932 RepID=G0QIR9_ICHMU|nr:hypothetical protein IMG5_001270 [Ichthyophthirius multifiliis]EGR34898.1 hypothetical protein IMG5_001270 [Ichthyophthirius multifiliis]|eukprot:XP_004040202.1 hypothetical protein IMG5_001270 [Ichthyophthirius multifiliis]
MDLLVICVGNSDTFFPLEMQVKFVSSDQLKLNMVFLFTFGSESNFLSNLGFGKGLLRNLQQNQSFQIPQSFNLQQILPKKNRFFIYQGSDTVSPCEPTIWLISYDTLKLNQYQLDDFPQVLSYQGRAIQVQKQEIYINFDIRKQNDEKQEDETQLMINNQDVLADSKINKIKDSIILLGDDTIYDPFIFGHSQIPSAKLIKDSDYIVLQKEQPEENEQQEDIEEQDQNEEKNNKDKNLFVVKKQKNIQQEKKPDNKKNEKGNQNKKTQNKEKTQNNKQKNKVSLQKNKDENNEQTEESSNISFISKKNENNNNSYSTQNNKEEKNSSNKESKRDKIPILKTDKWPELCKIGKMQSPININTQLYLIKEVTNNEIQIQYSQLNKSPMLVNDGIKITVVGQFGQLKYQNEIYFAQYVHIHHPSEHTFEDDNIRANIEIQIEHQNNNGKKLIVSLFGNAKVGNKNEFLQNIGIYAHKENQLQEIEKYIKLENLVLSLDQLVNKLDNYYKYEGSLTYPPCTEGVIWILSRDYININQDQIDNFITIIGMQNNIRGTHDLNGRQIFIN